MSSPGVNTPGHTPVVTGYWPEGHHNHIRDIRDNVSPVMRAARDGEQTGEAEYIEVMRTEEAIRESRCGVREVG